MKVLLNLRVGVVQAIGASRKALRALSFAYFASSR